MAEALAAPHTAPATIEKTVELMEQAGATPAEVRKYRESAARQIRIVDVLFENATTVRAFRRCYMPAVGFGMGGVARVPTSETNVRAVLALMRVPLADRLDVFDGVQLMQAAALPILND